MGNSTYTVDSGSIIFDGKDITEDAVNDRAKAGIFMSFQHPISIPGITVETSFVQLNPQLLVKTFALYLSKKN